MRKYNLIFTASDKHAYLWNGKSFDRLEDPDRALLMYSGKSVKDEDLEQSLRKCRGAAILLYPNEPEPKIKAVEVKVA